MASPLFFIHVTKTAGGTLKQALKGLKNHRVAFVYGQADREKLNAEDYDIIYGHYLYGIHEELGVPPRYAMFVRNPIDRVISHYYHLRDVEPGHVGDKIRRNPDINDYFQNGEYHWELDNLMTRILLAKRHTLADWQVASSSATRLLDTFEFVGVQDSFSTSIQRLEVFLGESLNIEKNVNVGSYARTDVTDETIRHLMETHKADTRLYAHAVQRALLPQDAWEALKPNPSLKLFV